MTDLHLHKYIVCLKLMETNQQIIPRKLIKIYLKWTADNFFMDLTRLLHRKK